MSPGLRCWDDPTMAVCVCRAWSARNPSVSFTTMDCSICETHHSEHLPHQGKRKGPRLLYMGETKTAKQNSSAIHWSIWVDGGGYMARDEGVLSTFKHVDIGGAVQSSVNADGKQGATVPRALRRNRQHQKPLAARGPVPIDKCDDSFSSRQ